MDYLQLVAKKVLFKKSRIILCIVNFTVGMFLMMLLLTIGVNVVQDRIKQTEYSLFAKQIYIYNFRDDFDISKQLEGFKNNPLIEGIQVYTESEAYMDSIEGNEDLTVEYKITTISEGYDYLPTYSDMVAGKPLNGQDEIILSSIFVRVINYTPDEVIGKILKVNYNNQIKKCKIVGVFLSTDKNLDSAAALMYDTKDAPINAIKIQAVDMQEVEKLSKALNEKPICHQRNHLSYINNQVLLSRFAAIVCAVIGSLLLIACTSILKTSLEVSTGDNLTFVSILKAQGFSNRQASKVFWTELIIIYIGSLISSIALYTLSLSILPIFIRQSLFGLNSNILSINLAVMGMVAIFALLLALLISVKPLRTIRQSDIISTLQNNVQ